MTSATDGIAATPNMYRHPSMAEMHSQPGKQEAISQPRTLAGTSSAMYIGEINEAMPMAIPLTIMAAINQATDCAEAVPPALTVKDNAGQYDHFATPEAGG
jgi:hypothetical protein